LRPDCLPPWDEAIRKHFKHDGSAESYADQVKEVRRCIIQLVEDAQRFGIKASEIGQRIGRPCSSLPKLVDEYFWATISSSIVPPKRGELEKWIGWAS